jgi:hypothetical protein
MAASTFFLKHRMQTSALLRNLRRKSLIQGFGSGEVNEFDVIILVEKNVARLEVPVDDLMLSQFLQSKDNLPGNMPR